MSEYEKAKVLIDTLTSGDVEIVHEFDNVRLFKQFFYRMAKKHGIKVKIEGKKAPLKISIIPNIT